MKTETRKVGRPSSKTEARSKLIFHSRELFTCMAYEKVSTRLIAQKAGVNSSLIRYYFGSKDGLFEAMLRETLVPMQERLFQLQTNGSAISLIDLMKTYYKVMGKMPKFPRLLFQVMNMPPTEPPRQLVEKVIMDITQPMQEMIFDSLQAKGVLQNDMDPKLCRITFLSLMMFPFIVPASTLSIHGVELSEEFLDRLLEHNLQVLTHGFLNTQESNPD